MKNIINIITINDNLYTYRLGFENESDNVMVTSELFYFRKKQQLIGYIMKKLQKAGVLESDIFIR